MHSSPVFADPSGRRRRLLRLLGAAAGLIIAVSLALITVGLAGGPQAPFISWAHPHRGAAPTVSKHPGHGSPPPPPPSAAVPVQPSPSADPQPSPSGSPSPSPSASPSESPTAAPAPTNPAGKTPPGQTKSPNPHRSGHGR
ncbi:MAG TPA: hypothetical protein VF204_14080 [Streptosporangiaceae bacterium]